MEVVFCAAAVVALVKIIGCVCRQVDKFYYHSVLPYHHSHNKIAL